MLASALLRIHLLTFLLSEFHKLPGWVRKFGPWGLVGAAIAMEELDEFAIALGVLVFGLLAFSLQIYDSERAEGKRLLTLRKIVFGIAIAGMLTLLAIIFLKRKGQKPWSNIEALNWIIAASGNALYFVYGLAPWRWVLPSTALAVVVTAILTFMLIRRASPDNHHSLGGIQIRGTGTVSTPCPYEWVHLIADYEKEHIDHAVVLLDCGLLSKNLNDDAPFVHFNFQILNLSVFSICVGKSIDGWIEFAGQRLGGNLKRTDTNASFSHRQTSWFVVTQWLSKEDVTRIRNASDQCTFDFEHLEVTIEGATDRFSSDTTVIKQPFKIKHKMEKNGRLASPICQDRWLHAIAENDRTEIQNAITVRSIYLSNETEAGKRYVDFKFAIFNKSVYEVSIGESLEGDIIFDKDELITEKRIDTGSAINCPVRGTGVFIIRQYLDSAEIKDFKNAAEDKTFRFHNLIVRVTGGADYPQVAAKRLSIEGFVSRKDPKWVNHDI